jgi:scyllo-inositol 2-dehydrogenase (NADP+)
MIRVGLVGFGLAGRVFHAPLVSSVEGFELAAVVERQSNLAAERYPGITTHRTLDALLADSRIDLVVVATPSGTHFEVIRQVLEAGKPVIADKPMCPTSGEIAELMALASRKNLPLIPFHNRRWDGDFQTVRNLLREGTLGRLVQLESHMDRWNPGATRVAWKDDGEHGGGTLLDLGTHLVDQALALFGQPLAVSAEVLRERDGQGANDAFTIRLRYATFRVLVEANALSSPAAARFRLRGTRGNFIKKGIDPQEAALKSLTRITHPHWGEEPAADWGMLHIDVNGGMVTRPVQTFPGDYRLYYAAVRDALLGKEPAPVNALEAWRVARILEWAQTSSDCRCEIECDWTLEPAV